MKMIYDIAEDEPIKEDEHVLELWAPLEFQMDKDYEYISDDFVVRLLSDFLYYGIAFPILKILTKIMYDLKIEGKENCRKLKTGAISVSNHVLILDCAMVGLAWGGKKTIFTTQEESFRIPGVRKLIKLLNAVPIPKGIQNRKGFIKKMDQQLQKGEVIHFYPETALWPYYSKIRKFKNGAFDFAVKNQVPIVPMVFVFRKPKGIRKYWKKKKDVTLKILKPVYAKENVENPVETLKQEVSQSMIEAI